MQLVAGVWLLAFQEPVPKIVAELLAMQVSLINFSEALTFARRQAAECPTCARGTTSDPGTSSHGPFQLGGSCCGTAWWRAAPADRRCEQHHPTSKVTQTARDLCFEEVDP